MPELFKVAEVTLTPLALLPGVGMLVVGLGFFAYALARRLGWRYLALGALLWALTVALKFAWAIPVNGPLYKTVMGALPQALANPLFYVYVGALTGVFEVGVTWLLLRYTRLGQASWGRVLAFGIGFGAIEAILVGLSPLVTVTLALVSPQSLPEVVRGSLEQLNNVWAGLAPVWERFFTIWVHIFSCALIFYAVVKRQARWFWLAFAYKTGIDAVAAYAQLSGLQDLAGLDPVARLWAIEAVVGVWGVVGMLGVRWLARRYPTPPQPAPVEASADVTPQPAPRAL